MTLGHHFVDDWQNERAPDPHADIGLTDKERAFIRAHNDGTAVGDTTMWPESYSKFTAEDAAEIAAFSYDRDITQLRPSLAKKVEYVPEKSTEETSVFRENRTGKYIVGYRGTVVDKGVKKEDAGADLLILTGRQKRGNRYKRAAQTIDDLGGPDNIRFVTGHSLGGNLADEVSRSKKVNAVAFAEGKSPLNGELLRKSNPNLQSYVTGIDPISVSNYLTQRHNVHYVKAKSWDPHGIGNFVNDRKLEKTELDFH